MRALFGGDLIELSVALERWSAPPNGNKGQESGPSAIGKADGVSGLSLKPSAFLKNDRF